MAKNSPIDKLLDISDEMEEELLNSPKNEASNNDIMRVLRTVASSTSKTNKTIDDYIKKNNVRVDNLESAVSETNAKVDLLADRMVHFEDLAQSAMVNNELQKQAALKSNIVVMGIPPTENENLSTLFMSIAMHLSADVTPNNINSIYRIRGSKSHSIVVKLNSFEAKIAMMSKKSKNSITLKDIPGSGSTIDKPVFISHHLTPYFAKLLAASRVAVNDGRLKASWITSNGLAIRFIDDTTEDSITTTDHLDARINQIKKASNKRPITMSPNEKRVTPNAKAAKQVIAGTKPKNRAAKIGSGTSTKTGRAK